MQFYITKFVSCFTYRLKFDRLQQVLEQQERNKDAGELTELVRDFLDPAAFFRAIKGIGIDYFCGVPDSLLKG